MRNGHSPFINSTGSRGPWLPHCPRTLGSSAVIRAFYFLFKHFDKMPQKEGFPASPGGPLRVSAWPKQLENIPGILASREGEECATTYEMPMRRLPKPFRAAASSPLLWAARRPLPLHRPELEGGLATAPMACRAKAHPTSSTIPCILLSPLRPPQSAASSTVPCILLSPLHPPRSPLSSLVPSVLLGPPASALREPGLSCHRMEGEVAPKDPGASQASLKTPWIPHGRAVL